jgi:flagellar biosynthesis anti-sigma factor FlgM
MDIRDIQPRSTPATESAKRAQNVSQAGAGKPRDDAADRVTVSNRGQDIQQAKQAALAVPPVREARVAAIKEQVKNGTLVPDPDRIAKALLSQGILS